MKLHYVFPNNISFNRSNGFTERTLFDVNCCLPTKNHSTCFYSKTSILIQPLRLSVMVLTQFEICSFKIIYTMHRCKLPKPTKIGYLDTQSSKRKFCAWLKRINWWSFFLRFITVMWQTWNQHSANFGLGNVFQLIVSTLGKREQVETLQTKRTIRRAIRNNIHQNIQYFSPCQVKIKMVSVV